MKTSPRRNGVGMKPHFWKEDNLYKVRTGMWIFVGFDLMKCHENMMYWNKGLYYENPPE